MRSGWGELADVATNHAEQGKKGQRLQEWPGSLPLMLKAIENAQNADSNPDGYMPELLQTKVYHLGRALYERMGKVRFEKFIATLPIIEKEILMHRKNKLKKS